MFGAIQGGRRSLVLRTVAVAIMAAIAVAGCGSSSSGNTVSAATYVKSVCGAASTWFHSIEGVGNTLKSATKSQGSLTKTKTAYTAFVVGVLHATQRAETQLKAAGTPSVSNGSKIESELVKAFSTAAQGLSSAATQAQQIPTTSKTAFNSAGGRVQAQVQQAISSMSTITPEKNPQLKAAAAKDPTCQQLKSLG